MTPGFPFAAIVAQHELKRALLVCGVDPSVGGVLIRGEKGTAKSTAARALAEILPPIERIAGCPFNCPPDAPYEHCTACADPHRTVAATAVPFVTLPLGATEDRVLGTLDLEQALKGGKRAFQPGLLAAAHRGVLYVDEVNLLPDHLVDVLLDAAAMGVNVVQREGVSLAHPARFTLIGTMNPEEGDLRPQLLDRFGLMVEIAAPREKALRVEVVRRRIAYERDAAAFAGDWAATQETLRQQLAAAQRLAPEVRLADSLLDLISGLCCECEVASLRADIVMHKTARILAALEARTDVSAADVRQAAELALPHRHRRKPFEQPRLDPARLDELMRDAAPTPSDDAKPPPEEADADQGDAQRVFTAASSGGARHISVESITTSHTTGRRSSLANATRGHVVRAIPDARPTSLAVAATLRSAALRSDHGFEVARTDLHQQLRAGKTANLILFVVDASGSMAAQQRMSAVKGAVLTLLTDAYQRRDQVAVIAFRGASAKLLVAPTRSVDLAEQGLRDLPTGGRTPLAHALQLAAACLEKAAAAGPPPLLVLLSDGKANVPIDPQGDPWSEALAVAEQLARRGVPALVLDTEVGYLRLGRARVLAQALGGEHLALEALSAETLALAIRRRTSPVVQGPIGP